jgi:predicted DNA binding CopG/RHH family protein
MAKKPYPEFASEAEEAAWLDAHLDEIEDYWEAPTPEQEAAMKKELEGLRRTPPEKLAELEAQAKARTEQIALRVPIADLGKAKSLAAKKGIGYQTLLKNLIHDGLEREYRQAAGE